MAEYKKLSPLNHTYDHILSIAGFPFDVPVAIQDRRYLSATALLRPDTFIPEGERA